jgi:hypothetical protein
MRPASFDGEQCEQWSRWVLQNGLPPLPGSELATGESVPVAYWIGPTTAAVLHIRRIQDEDDDEVLTETDIDLFCWVGGRWEGFGSGGGGWYDDSPLERRELAPDVVNLGGMNSGSHGIVGCKALSGEVGADAAIAEVHQAGRVTRRAVEAPVGAFVVCGEYNEPFTVRVVNADGDLLAEIEESAGTECGPPWSRL